MHSLEFQVKDDDGHIDGGRQYEDLGGATVCIKDLWRRAYAKLGLETSSIDPKTGKSCPKSLRMLREEARYVPTNQGTSKDLGPAGAVSFLPPR